jgi:hypothetical protein
MAKKKKMTLDSLKPKKQPMLRRAAAKHTNGKRYGLGVTRFIANLFRLNEKAPKHKKMTDAEIARQIRIEYPQNETIQKTYAEDRPDLSSQIAFQRSQYNRGRLVVSDGPPRRSEVSFCYNENGDAVNTRYANPRILTESDKEDRRNQLQPHRDAFEKALADAKAIR